MKRLVLDGWVALFCGGMVSLVGADWPQWRGPTRTGLADATEPAVEKLSSDLNRVWKQPLGDGFASPIVVQKMVIIADNQEGREMVHAFRVNDGREVWKSDLDDVHKDGFGAGPRCTAAADSHQVYVQSCRGELQALSLTTGARAWSVNYVRDFQSVYIGEKGNAAGAARHGYNGTPLLDGPHLIAVVGGANGAGVVCFNKDDGQVVWKSSDATASYSPPQLASLEGVPQVIAFTVQGLIGLDRKTGAALWSVPLTTTFGRHVIAPIIHGDLVIVASHMVGTVAIKVFKTGDHWTATQAWLNKEALINFSTPVAVGSYFYGVGPRADLACYAIATGARTWTREGEIATSADKAFAGFAVVGSNVFCLTDGGTLILYRAEAKQFSELGRSQVCGANWCNPAISDGRMFVRDRRELICVSLK